MLAPALGREMVGASYKHVVRSGEYSFVMDAGAWRDLEIDTVGFEVEEVKQT